MIRKAQSSDIDKVIQLRMDLIREANDLDKMADVTQLQKNIVSYFEEHLNKDFFVWVIEEEGEIVAISGLNLFCKPPTYSNYTGKEAFIMNIYVVPASRGNGYATCLVKEILNYSKEIGCEKVTLVATEAGRVVYEKIGFKIKNSVMEYSL
ncbi:MAG: family N-acetyltransferase [Clostridia bacterium]|nr:family N-acetyltransferase [Clostridia bacterium]